MTRMILKAALAVTFVLAFLLLGDAQDASATAGQDRLLQLINEKRAAYGVAPLRMSPLLNASAQAKSEDMASNGYFAHISPSGVTPEMLKQRYGYPPNAPGWGENILWSEATADDAFWSWWSSAPHRENMLSATYTEVGIGGPVSGNYYWGVWTLHFGNANTAAPAPNLLPPPPPVNGAYVADGPLRLRSAPSTSATIYTSMPTGTAVDIVSGPVYGSGVAWYEVSSAYGWGYAAADYIYIVSIL